MVFYTMSIINGDWPPKKMAEVDHWGLAFFSMAEVDHWGFQVALSQLRECAGVVGQWMNLPSGNLT